MSAFIGIDLGTTYSAISTIDQNGIPKIINNSEGQNITPSCIWINDDKKYQVGEEARKEYGSNDSVIARFKRDMGTKQKYSVNGEELTPTDCSALILKKLFKDAQKEVGDIGETVVTIPANFTNEARAATLEAAKSAGLNVKNIVVEVCKFKQSKGEIRWENHTIHSEKTGSSLAPGLIDHKSFNCTRRNECSKRFITQFRPFSSNFERIWVGQKLLCAKL